MFGSLPDHEKFEDPIFGLKVQRAIGGQLFCGEVVDIEKGVISGEIYYRVKYEDGDQEHLTEEELLEVSF